MSNPIFRMLARLGRVLIGGALAGAVYSGVEFLQDTPIGIFIIPVGTALVSGVGKLVRDKWGIKLPF